MQYVPGKQNIAVSLSRLVEKGGLSGNDDAEEFTRFVAEASESVAIPIREIDVEESATDPEISYLRECILTGDWEKASSQYKHENVSTKKNELAYTKKTSGRVLDLAHEDHQLLVKINKGGLRTKVWWAGIDKQVES